MWFTYTTVINARKQWSGARIEPANEGGRRTTTLRRASTLQHGLTAAGEVCHEFSSSSQQAQPKLHVIGSLYSQHRKQWHRSPSRKTKSKSAVSMSTAVRGKALRILCHRAGCVHTNRLCHSLMPGGVCFFSSARNGGMHACRSVFGSRSFEQTEKTKSKEKTLYTHVIGVALTVCA